MMDKQQPIGYPIKADLFPPKLLDKMKKQPLNQTERGKLLDCIYDDIPGRFHTYYLSSFQYGMIADALLKFCPLLREGLHPDGAKALWHRRLKDKFKNSRKRSDSSVPCVIEKKRKKSTESTTSPTQNLWGVKNFRPRRREADDDESIESYIKFMQEQSKLDKGCRKEEMIQERMEWTFPERRNSITQDLLPTADIKSIYPLLFDEEQIIQEMNRLTETDTEITFNQNLEVYARRIINLKPQKREGAVKDLRNKVAMTQEGADKMYVTKSVALLLIPLFLNDKPDLFYRQFTSADAKPGAHISYNGKVEDILDADKVYTIKVEQVTVCHTKSLSKAFLLLLSAYYVFNLEYAKGTSSSLHFLQKILLDIDDGTVKKDTKLLNFITKINRVSL